MKINTDFYKSTFTFQHTHHRARCISSIWFLTPLYLFEQMILLGSQNTHWLQLRPLRLMEIPFFLNVSLDSGKDESQTGLNQEKKQFKSTIKNFSHRLYVCVNTRFVCPFSQKALPGLTRKVSQVSLTDFNNSLIFCRASKNKTYVIFLSAEKRI